MTSHSPCSHDVAPCGLRQCGRVRALLVLVLAAFAGVLALMPAGPVRALGAAEAQLAMFQQPGCVYCLRWDQDVSGEYPLTAEGRAAPLRRLELRDPLPEGISLARPVQFTPTFVLLVNGAEAGRIEGYPGEDFFWGLLQSLLVKAGLTIE